MKVKLLVLIDTRDKKGRIEIDNPFFCKKTRRAEHVFASKLHYVVYLLKWSVDF